MIVIFQGFNKITLFVGFLFGISLAYIFYKTEENHHRTFLTFNEIVNYPPLINHYFQWFSKQHLKRTTLDNDFLSYANSSEIILGEDQLLYNKIHITCIVFVYNRKKAEMVKATYGNKKHCNRVVFFASFVDENLPIVTLKSKSTWHHLCQSLLYLWSHQSEIHWVLVLHDELFAIPENLRYYVAEMGFNYNDTYYFGNPMSFWGQTYNSAKSGYVLSRGTLETFDAFFNMTDGRSCSTGFNWRNEDFYLGKYLAEMGVMTRDTRDIQGRGRFHGYGLDRLLTVGGISTLDNYRKKGVYFVQEGFACCSNTTITFRASDPGDLFLFNYLLNQVKVFHNGGYRGNQPYPVSQEDIWLRFMKNINLENVSLTPDEFQNLWDSRPEE